MKEKSKEIIKVTVQTFYLALENIRKLSTTERQKKYLLILYKLSCGL